MEYLTDEVERRAQDYLRRIDEMGGALAAIEQGYIQREIQDAAYAYQQAVERGEQIIVGVNAFQIEEDARDLEALVVDPALEAEQRRRLAALRQRRDAQAVAEILARIEAAARSDDEPLMPLFVEAVERYATLGEIVGVLRQVWGEYQPPVGF